MWPDPSKLLSQLPVNRQKILLLLKRRGKSTTMELASELGVTHEAVRRHLADLQQDGFVQSDCGEDGRGAQIVGRPSVKFCLTPAGDHFFPKRYDELATLLVDAAEDGAGTFEDLLAALTQRRVRKIPAPRSEQTAAKVKALHCVYLERDPYIESRRDGDDFVITERNCPYLNVALERPAVCSTTVSLMRQVLGFEVVREERFQDGDGCCSFRVLTTRPVSERRRRQFEFEPPKEAGPQLR